MKEKIKKPLIISTILGSLFLLGNFIYAHPGNTDAYGCHTCRTNCEKWGLSYGEYHCHTPKTLPQPVLTPTPILTPTIPSTVKPITESAPEKYPLTQADISAGIPEGSKEGFSWFWFLLVIGIAYFSYKLGKRRNRKEN